MTTDRPIFMESDAMPINAPSSIAQATPPAPERPFPLRAALALAALHGLLALVLYLRGMSIVDRPGYVVWDWLWQVINKDDLLHRPWQSMWWLHANPPGFDLWGWFWLMIVGPRHFNLAAQFNYIVFGCLAVVFTMRLALALTADRRLTLIIGVLMAVNPSLFIYEAYLLYDMAVFFLVVASAFGLLRVLESALTGRPWRLRLASWIAVLNVLVLTRSLYHLAFLAVAMLFAWPVWRRMPVRTRLAWWIAALMLPFLLYAKNQMLFGFFGSSSWFGMSLYKTVSRDYSHDEQVALSRLGLMPAFIPERYPYQHSYRDYIQFGFNKTSTVPLISRDTFHNINFIDISREYQRASVRMILHDPVHYLKNVIYDYGLFCIPPVRLHLLEGNRSRYLSRWEPIYSNLLYAPFLTDFYQYGSGFDCGSLFFFYFPWLLVGAAVFIAHRCRPGPLRTDPRQQVRAWLMGYLLFVSVYVTVIGNLFENKENTRFRFAIEPFTIILTLMCLRWLWRRLPGRCRDWLTPKGRSRVE